jgi:hypothetical protein
MSVKLFTLLLDDPEPVFDWLRQHGEGHVVRQQAERIGSMWPMNAALDDPRVCDSFRAQWFDVLVTFKNQLKWLRRKHLF